MAQAINNQRRSNPLYQWIYENLEGFSWAALWVFGCLLVVFTCGLFLASRYRSVVVLENDSAAAIHDVSLRPLAASSREPKHFLPHLAPHASESFVIYPLSSCPVVLNYRDNGGNEKHWQGGRISPHGGQLKLHITNADGNVSVE